MARARTRTRRNAWPGQRAAHKVAAHIGWAYRPKRKGPDRPMAYLRAAGLSRASLRKYRGGRKTSPSRLLAKRGKRKTRPRGRYITRPFLVNSYRSFVGRFIRARRPKGVAAARAAMRAAAAAWRSGRRNADPFPMLNRNPYALPGSVYYDNRRKRGKSRGRHADNRRRAKSSRRRGARRNPVLPHMAWDNRRRGRRYSRNPVLPYAAFNRRSADNPFEAVYEGVETIFTPEFWKDTVLPLGAGFVGGQFVGGMVQSLAEKLVGAQTGVLGSIQRVGSRALGSAVVSGLALIVTKDKDVASKVLAGGLVAVLAGVLQEIFGSETYAKMTGMSGLFGGMAQDLTEELKQRIAQSVRGEIAAAEGGAPAGGVSAFVTTQDMSTAPHLGPGPRMGDFVSTEALQTAPVAQQYGAPGDAAVVADLSAFSDSFADMMLV